MVRFPLPRLARCFRPTCTIMVAATAACGGAATTTRPIPLSPVQGKLNVRTEAGTDTSLAPLVVMLEPVDGGDPPGPGNRTVRVTSTTDLFEPPFTAVSVGDTVILVNEGRLQHRFFSPDLEADLGADVVIPVAPAGQYASVDFIASGTKRLYCSLHPDEAFSIFVSRTPFYAVLEPDGSYVIPDVPDGRYRLTVWSDLVSGLIRRVRVDSGQSGVENIWIDLSRIDR